MNVLRLLFSVVNSCPSHCEFVLGEALTQGTARPKHETARPEQGSNCSTMSKLRYLVAAIKRFQIFFHLPFQLKSRIPFAGGTIPSVQDSDYLPGVKISPRGSDASSTVQRYPGAHALLSALRDNRVIYSGIPAIHAQTIYSCLFRSAFEDASFLLPESIEDSRVRNGFYLRFCRMILYWRLNPSHPPYYESYSGWSHQKFGDQGLGTF